MEQNADKPLVCVNCKQEFVWTAGEQAFYQEKGLPQPEHCLICRGIMKAKSMDPGARAKFFENR